MGRPVTDYKLVVRPRSDNYYVCVRVCVRICACAIVCACVCTCMCICKQLPSNQNFDKQISSHQKGGGVSRWGEWVGKATAYKFDTCTLIGVHSTMHLVDLIKVYVSLCIECPQCLGLQLLCVYMCICSLLPGNQILISKYLARRGVVVSGGWSNGSGWQQTPK